MGKRGYNKGVGAQVNKTPLVHQPTGRGMPVGGGGWTIQGNMRIEEAGSK